MLDVIKNAPTRGIPELDESLEKVAAQAAEVMQALAAERGMPGLCSALIRFTIIARDHLRREQSVMGRSASVPQYWRHFRLARVLDDLQQATLATPMNRVHLERLLEQWASEQFIAVVETRRLQ